MNCLVLFISILLLPSCSIFGKKGQWGRDALWPISGSRIGKAFIKNAKSPHVWIPLAGAGIIHLGGQDRRISKWASEEKNIYHDQENTDLWSDQFNNILLYEMYLTIFLTPSLGEDDSLTHYALNKVKGGLVVNIASQSTRYARDQVAKTVRRQRPNRTDYLSFPSGHATEASSRNMLVSKNLDSMEMDPNLRFGIKTINTTMALGTLWARVEGNRHYTSDVLAGYALGSFISGFVYDSLMNLDSNESFTVIPLGNQVSAQYTIYF